jgi:glutathione S-transferase
MIRFYFHPTPNPAKIALMLEEVGLAYEVVPVDTSKGEQHKPEFRAINPNGKVPAIVDTEGPGGKETRVFDSGAILLYLGEKTGRLLGSPADKGELLRGFSSSRRVLVPSRGKRFISNTRLPKSSRTRSIATAGKWSAIMRCSIRI